MSETGRENATKHTYEGKRGTVFGEGGSKFFTHTIR